MSKFKDSLDGWKKALKDYESIVKKPAPKPNPPAKPREKGA